MVQIIRNPSGFAGYSVNPNTGTFTAPFMGFTNQRIPLPKNAVVQNRGRSALDNIYGMSTNRSVAANPPSVVAFNNAMNQGLLNRRTPTKSSGMFVDPATDNPLLRNFPALLNIPEDQRQFAKIVDGKVVFDLPEEMETQNQPETVEQINKRFFPSLEDSQLTSGQRTQTEAKTQTGGFTSQGQELAAQGLITPPTTEEAKTIKDKASKIGTGLLDFAQSTAGRGFITGLLKASGYSTTPVGFGQALGLAFEESDKAVQQELANQLAKDKLKLAESQVGKFEQVMIEVPDGKGGTRKVPANRNTVTGEIKPIISASGNVFNVGQNQSKGFAALDSAAAKSIESWSISGGFAQVQENLGKIDDVIEILKTNPNITGAVVGNMPTALRVILNPESVAVEDDINSNCLSIFTSNIGSSIYRKRRS